MAWLLVVAFGALGAIHGTVVDTRGGAPIGDVAVRLQSSGQRVVTDASGRFSFSSNPGTSLHSNSRKCSVTSTPTSNATATAPRHEKTCRRACRTSFRRLAAKDGGDDEEEPETAMQRSGFDPALSAGWRTKSGV